MPGPAAHWATDCRQFTTTARLRTAIHRRRETEEQQTLTIQVELHVRIGASVETMLARALSEIRLRGLLSSNFDVEIERSVEIGDWAVVDVEEIVVQEQSEVVFRSRHGLLERSLDWGQLVQVRDVLGHIRTPLALVSRHERRLRVSAAGS